MEKLYSEEDILLAQRMVNLGDFRRDATFTSITNRNVKRKVQDKYNVKYDEKQVVIDSVLSETIKNIANPDQFY
ncbi:hypothetical protein [Bacillus cereus]|uniref:hypothetical protein n=1 Tax=Bacillus cereus TaxID=1396 RepID=UPI003D95E37A